MGRFTRRTSGHADDEDDEDNALGLVTASSLSPMLLLLLLTLDLRPRVSKPTERGGADILFCLSSR